MVLFMLVPMVRIRIVGVGVCQHLVAVFVAMGAAYRF
jgi:hypothetical protein